jgi:hypothetical protein
MSISKLYHTWRRKILQMRPGERKTRVETMAWLIAGIFESKSVQLSRIASKLPGQAMLRSATKRLERFVDNSAIQVRDWYEPIARDLLQGMAGHEYRLIVDGSKVGPWHQLLLISLAYRKRAIPLAWMWVRTPRGHSTAIRQLALLRTIRKLLPADAQVLLVGDQEFGAVAVLRQLDQWHWKYVLHQKGSFLIRADQSQAWRKFQSVIEKPGQCVWLGEQQLTQEHAYSVNLLAYWQIGEEEPWFLATNLPTQRAALQAYRRRMWIEGSFGDLKDNGFDLESTRLHTVQRLNRLTLAVVLLYLDLLISGGKAIKAGLRRLVDRKDRRDLSVFRIGLYLRERHLANSQSFSVSFCPIL